MKDQLSEEEFYNLLFKAVKDAGSQKNYAAKLGISQSYLSDVLAMRRDPGMKIHRDLGYFRTWVYVPYHENLNPRAIKKAEAAK